nr:type II toxin-antitoxin system HicA family toxin [uncultured Gellertiella sp.]
MNAKELKRYLKNYGCRFENHRGGSGHITVYLGARKSQLPMHGGNKDLGVGLVKAILKQLGIDKE